MRIGILGGTFDPVHEGHLYLARKVSGILSLEKIIFIPTYLPPHKKNIRIASAAHRYNMLKLAVKNNKKFEASDIEIKRKHRSYSIETMRQLRRKYGPCAEIFFITGSDSLRELDTWRRFREMLGLCRFVVVKRPHFKLKGALQRFIVLRINARDISSTDIRHRIKKSLPITKLVPKKVRDYIQRHRLYS